MTSYDTSYLNQAMYEIIIAAQEDDQIYFDRYDAASEILYEWACEKIQTDAAKAACLRLGYRIDFRQPDLGNWVEADDLETGQYVEIYF